MSLAAVICSNGLGHFRRVAEILSRVVNSLPELHVSLVCSQWQPRLAAGTPAVESLLRSSVVEVVDGIMEPGVRWETDPDQLRDGRLLAWQERLEAWGGLEDADLVISDNLGGTLSLRGDAVLMGSFLWSTVMAEAFPGVSEVSAFVRNERELIERYRPPMLCVEGFAMPDVLARTRAIPVPWMCPAIPGNTPKRGVGCRPKVAVIAGASGVADAEALAVVREILCESDIEVAVPKVLVARLPPSSRIVDFGYRPEDFYSCSAVFCRPGMGTIHECIAYRMPMVFFREPGNVEMAYNARAAQDLGLGVDLGTGAMCGKLRAALHRILDPQVRADIINKMEHGRSDGLDVAARWLLDRLRGK